MVNSTDSKTQHRLGRNMFISYSSSSRGRNYTQPASSSSSSPAATTTILSSSRAISRTMVLGSLMGFLATSPFLVKSVHGYGNFQYGSLAGNSMGQWDLVGVSGVSAMHAILIPNTDRVVFLEKVEQASNAWLSATPDNRSFAWSVEYNIATNTFRPLKAKTNLFCSAGGYRPDGTIVSLGGAEPKSNILPGWDSLRFLSACNATESTCDWDQRDEISLGTGRWYPTAEALADGRLFIIGGATKGASVNDAEIGVASWELYPPAKGAKPTPFKFLEDTLPYNLYPIVHLLPDGNLFIFANTQGIIFSTTTWEIIKTLPPIPGPPRNYPLSGGSVLLPLRPESNYEAEVLICGGATEFSSHAHGQDTCGRIKPLSKNPQWVMETMPLGRMMPDMNLLADGSVLMLNGANKGTAGYGRAKKPVMEPVQYRSFEQDLKQRFQVQSPSYIPRLYHSIAMPIPDGRVMVAGSNPNANTLDLNEYPSEYRVEMFSPGYLFSNVKRPTVSGKNTITKTVSQPDHISVQELATKGIHPERGVGEGATLQNLIYFDQEFELEFELFSGKVNSVKDLVTEKNSQAGTAGGAIPPLVQLNLLNAGFVTHSTHMSQRLVGLEILGYEKVKEGEAMILKAKGPKDGALTPPGWYQLYLVEDGVPSQAIWVKIGAPAKKSQK